MTSEPVPTDGGTAVPIPVSGTPFLLREAVLSHER
jgi:hypothetical protein